jgi:hypothetical protein
MFGSVVTSEVPAHAPGTLAPFVRAVYDGAVVVDWHLDVTKALLAGQHGSTRVFEVEQWLESFAHRRWVGDQQLLQDLTRIAASQNQTLVTLRHFARPESVIEAAALGSLLGEIARGSQDGRQWRAGGLRR